MSDSKFCKTRLRLVKRLGVALVKVDNLDKDTEVDDPSCLPTLIPILV